MQEKSLYGKFKVVVSHLYHSITSEDDLKLAMAKRRLDFVMNEIVILGEEIERLKKEIALCEINKALDDLDKPKSEFDEFEEFKE